MNRLQILHLLHYPLHPISDPPLPLLIPHSRGHWSSCVPPCTHMRTFRTSTPPLSASSITWHVLLFDSPLLPVIGGHGAMHFLTQEKWKDTKRSYHREIQLWDIPQDQESCSLCPHRMLKWSVYTFNTVNAFFSGRSLRPDWGPRWTRR